MELHYALRELVEKWGDDIITDESRLIKMLGSKRAYTERPETKEIVKFAIEIGYFDKIYEACQSDDWEDMIPEIESEFNEISSPMGFDEDDVNYVFGCIPFALGLIELDENDFLIDNEDTDDNDIYDSEDDDYIEEDLYTITKQYHENKGVDIYVVRLTNRVDSDTFETFKKTARKYGKGYYSTFRGVNGFVFYSMDDAREFVDNIFDNELNDIDDEKETSSPQHNPDQLNDSDKIKSISSKTDKHQYDLNNMELHLALRNIIDTDGIDIINDIRLVNILSDFKAFDAIPASKYILRSIISDGYSNKLLAIGQWNAKTIALCHTFITNTGFQEEYVDIIFQSIAYGLHFIDKVITKPIQQPSSNKPNQNNVTLSLNLTQSELNRKSEKFILTYKDNVESYLDSIIEVKGDIKGELGADVIISSEFDTSDNSFCLNFEISGPMKYKFEDDYSSYLSFIVVLYDTNNKLVCKEVAMLQRENTKKKFQVITSNWFLSRKFKHISDIKKIIVYWEE